MSVVAALALTGCGVVLQHSGPKQHASDYRKPAPPPSCLTNFFVDYAVLAADVYRTRGASTERIQLFAEPALARALPNGRQLEPGMVSRLFAAAKKRRCAVAPESLGHTEPTPFDLARGQCKGADTTPSVLETLQEMVNEGDEESVDEVPSADEQCGNQRGEKPYVPVSRLTADRPWVRARDIEKYSTTRSWRVFVPDLAIEVWRRQRSDTQPAGRLEYAIVFRGTTGSGGWLSNFRLLTAMAPIFWDQYKQAQSSATRIIEQIYVVDMLLEQMELESDPAPRRNGAARQRPLITAVGHSLGAGLAKFVYYKIPEVTRVVGFNPSPVDGSNSLIRIDERPEVMRGRMRDPAAFCRADGQTDGDDASMFFLYEHGEILSSIEPCHPGPLWGAEGGPVSLCRSVNLSHGNPIRQHGMNTLACKLSLLHYAEHRQAAQPPAAETLVQTSEAAP